MIQWEIPEESEIELRGGGNGTEKKVRGQKDQ